MSCVGEGLSYLGTTIKDGLGPTIETNLGVLKTIELAAATLRAKHTLDCTWPANISNDIQLQISAFQKNTETAVTSVIRTFSLVFMAILILLITFIYLATSTKGNQGIFNPETFLILSVIVICIGIYIIYKTIINAHSSIGNSIDIITRNIISDISSMGTSLQQTLCCFGDITKCAKC
jgi:heme/copper-type cytochrome/quinol oxidase subunit 4